MSEETATATPLERAVWQIGRGIEWQRTINSDDGMQITVDVLLDVLRHAAGEAGVEDQIADFYPNTLDDVLAKAREMQEANG